MNYPTAKCRTCGALIVWTITAKGKRMPVDAMPVKGGNLTIERIDVPYRTHERGELNAFRSVVVMPGEGDRVSHFVTCPQALEHRR